MEDLRPLLQGYAHHLAEEHREMAAKCIVAKAEWTLPSVPAQSRRTMEQLCFLEHRLAMVYAQLAVAIDRLAEIEHLAHICSPEVLVEQLQDIVDDDEFVDKMAAPALKEEALTGGQFPALEAKYGEGIREPEWVG